ncbi:MAG: hypothetical protein ACOC32_02285 [Nanoarchaeota archaeon]
METKATTTANIAKEFKQLKERFETEFVELLDYWHDEEEDIDKTFRKISSLLALAKELDSFTEKHKDMLSDYERFNEEKRHGKALMMKAFLELKKNYSEADLREDSP